MSGNQNQYDPLAMFQKWIQKSGEAQNEFMQNFASLMKNDQAFNPLDTLRTVTEKAVRTQSDMVERVAVLQNRAMEGMFGLGHALPSFANWGVYKTTVGSNGRISIPEAERDALGLGEGDLVQVIVLPVSKKPKKEVKQ